nr:MAG TPA: hypothetical protein [Caudoviricetes sp.]
MCYYYNCRNGMGLGALAPSPFFVAGRDFLSFHPPVHMKGDGNFVY